MSGAGEEEKSRRNMMVSSSSTTGFCYSDITTTTSTNPNIHHIHLLNQHHQIQNSFDDSDHSNNNPPENFFNLTTGGGGSMDEMINPPPPPPPPAAAAAASASAWKGFFNNKHHDLMTHHQSTAAASNWQHQQNDEDEDEDDDASLMRCVFSCEGNERPSQGLSLSLSSTNPSTIGLQSFELRHINTATTTSTTTDDHHPFLYSSNQQHHHQQISNQFFQLRNSKFLSPAQQLLNEFCGIGNNQISSSDDPSSSQYKNKNKNKKNTNHHQQEEGTSTSSRNLHSLELIELQKRKAKLLSMLEEVDRRYKHYCDQMKAVVSSFESVAGNGAATVYSALASKAMSRHFRCLRDGIVGQIQDTKKAMGEKDPMVVVAPGTTKGETPRLRLLDQTLRQQRALQQMTMMETHPWRPQRGLPERSVSVLRAWLFEHFLHPYPSDVDKHILARQTGLSRSQVSNWFINARVRLWKPMVEEMYLEETKEHHHQRQDDDNNNMASLLFDGATATTTTATTTTGGGGGGLILDDDDCLLHPQNQNPQDQKPTHDQLVRIDSECLSSIISPNLEKTEDKDGKTLPNHHYHQSFGRVGSSTDTYGAMELDFSSYNHHNAAAYQNFIGGVGGSGGGVSLTLGLQQHGGNGGGGGVNLAFSSAASSQNSLFYSRDHHIDDCQPVVQYSMLDGEGQNLPYRNLLGAQLLHDLAG